MNVNDEIAIGLIEHYISTNLELTPFCLKQTWLSERLYARWAAEEILMALKEHSLSVPEYITGRYEQDVFDIIDCFEVELHMFQKVKKIDAFAVALDTCKSIRKYLKNNLK